MRRTHRKLAVIVAVLTLAMGATPVAQTASIAPNEGAFYRTWARTDQPVAAGHTLRTWIWGPSALTASRLEPYSDAPNGHRQVQYFDKARMEDNAYRGTEPWDVTTGLLVVEMVEGSYQIGDADYDDSPEPAQVNIAGDPGERPTYADIASLALRSAPAVPEGTTLTATFTEDNTVGDDPRYAAHGVTGAQYVAATDHTVASPFWAFMTSEATVWEEGQYLVDDLFENAYYATGYPITEAYWSIIAVGGSERDVLWQCFERRCLTYSPTNPTEWQVEFGNVGRHYYTWRFGALPESYGIAFTSNRSGTMGLFTMDENGADATRLTDIRSIESAFDIAPDGTRIAFVLDYQNTPFSDIYVMNIDGSGLTNLTSSLDESPALIDPTVEPVWSPDSQQIAYGCYMCPDPGFSIYIMRADGSDVRRIAFFSSDFLGGGGSMGDLAWSPDGESLALSLARAHEPADIYLVASDGSSVINLTNHPDWDSQLAWSPDGTRIAFVSVRDGMPPNVFVMQADGSGVTNLTRSGWVTGQLDWSPDGSRIAYMGYGSIYVIAADGSWSQQLTGTSPGSLPGVDGSDFLPRWSPDGQRIAFVSHRDGNAEIYVMQADGSQQVNLTNDPGIDNDSEWIP